MKRLNDHLKEFTGTTQYYQMHPNFLLTDGIKYACTNYGLYWFMTIIWSYQMYDKFKKEKFQHWILRRLKDDAFSFIVICFDGNNNIIDTQNIPFSDFKMDVFEVYYTNNVVLLPSEN